MDNQSILDSIPLPTVPSTETKESTLNKSGGWKDDPIYTPLEIPKDSLTTANAFVVGGPESIPSDIVEFIETTVMPKLLKKRLILRSSANDRDPMEALFYPTYTFKEFYLAWKSINKLVQGTLNKPKEMAHRYALDVYTHTRKNYNVDTYNNNKSHFKAFDAVRIHQVLGENLDSKVKFILIYTPGGSTEFIKQEDYNTKGYGLNFIAIARYLGIKVYNLGNPESKKEFEIFLDSE